MFRKFFKVAANAIKTYVSKNGIIRSVCNAIEATILGSGLVVFLSTAFKRWRTKRKFAKLLKQQGINEKEYYENNDHGVYDKNGYRLTNDEIYRKNKSDMKEIEELYANDDIRDCVAIIEKHEPKIFKGMSDEQKFRYVKDNNLTLLMVLKRYGLDSESQMKKLKAEIEKAEAEDEGIQIDDKNLQSEWNKDEDRTIGVASKVPGSFKRKRKKKPGTVEICNPMEYAAMEMTYGCADFNYADPSSESELRRLRRMKFDEAVSVTGSWMSWNYLYDKKMWEHWMRKSNGDPVQIWRYTMLLFLDDDNAFNTIKKELEKKARDVESEMRGHRTSKRPKINSIEDAKLLDKMEDALERLDELEMDKKRNTPIEDADDDEEINEDDLDNDCNEIMGDSDDILDQLDALRSGKITGNETEEELAKMNNTEAFDTPEVAHTIIDAYSDEVVTHETHTPVKMKTREDIQREAEEEEDPELIKISPRIYTIELRAQKILKLFDERYATDHDFARISITNMLEDESGKNYEIYESSPTMQENRKQDREHGLPWKAVPCDYRGKPNNKEFLTEYQKKMNEFGISTWKQMVDDRTMYYRNKFEYDTVDKMLEMLPDSGLSHETQIAFIAMLLHADHNYEIEIESSKCIDLIEEAKKVVYEVPVVDLSGKLEA